jgi:hypothetical protein
MDLRFVRSATLAEAVDHCPLSRADLREAVDAAGVGERVAIPADGERLRR